jgi:VWFA-related protein
MLKMSFGQAVRVAVAAAQCALLVVAQQPLAEVPSPSSPDVVFSVTTLRVQVDAVVTDSKGRYVTDLTADDFAIYQDGKPQKITNFSYVGVTAPPQRAARNKLPEKSSAALPPPPTPVARREDVKRTIVLMVDDLGLSFEAMANVRDSLRKFVERQMQPGDLVAICRTGGGSGAAQQFTLDKRILLSIIDGLRWNLNGRVANVFAEPNRNALNGNGVRSGDPGAINDTYNAQRNTVFTVGTLGALSYIIGALREMPGRKSIVLFSDGLQLFTPGQGPVMHTGMAAQGSMDSDSNDEIQRALHRLLDLANRAGTVIYTIHTLGLQPNQPSALDRLDSAGFGMTAEQAHAALEQFTATGQGRDVNFIAGQQGLAYLAQETGGIPYENGNDFNYGLDHVLQDQQGYYLIGFKPASGTFDMKRGERSYHHIAVKVTRAGLHVRSRSGFFGETDGETSPNRTPLEQMRAAMLSPFHSSSVRLRLTALYAEAPKGGAIVRNLIHIDARDLTFQLVVSSEPAAKVEMVAVATSLGFVPVGTVAQSYEIHLPAKRPEQALEEGLVYTLDVPVKKPGAYQIQVAVRDTVSGKIGSASQFLEIPELKKGRVTLTSVLLQSAERPPGALAWTGMSPATRQFHPGGTVEYFCLLESATKKDPAMDLDSQIRIVRDGKDVYSGPAKLVAMDGGGWAVAGGFKLSEKMTPGDYYLGVVVADRTAKNRLAAQWTDFEVVQ